MSDYIEVQAPVPHADGMAMAEAQRSGRISATTMRETALATNRHGWNHVAKYFHGSTALPEYGPLAPTEDTLRLLDDPTGACVLELGCGSGHSLRYLAGRGARELSGLDLSSTQISFAEETLRPY